MRPSDSEGNAGLAALPLIAFVIGLAACDDGAEHQRAINAVTSENARRYALEQCIQRGVTYFKELGSYPTLKSAPNEGRYADDVAEERCKRTPTAF